MLDTLPKVCFGVLSESEYEVLLAIRKFIAEAIKDRMSMHRVLSTIAVRLEGRTQNNDLLICSEELHFENAVPESPLDAGDEELLDDVDAFVRSALDNGLRFELICATLLHDIHGILEGSKVFAPRVRGYAKLNWDAWSDDLALQSENDAINAEFRNTSADGLGSR